MGCNLLKIDFTDEGLRGALNNFISALLPHEYYEPELFMEILATIFKYVKLKEFQLEYRLLLEALYNLGKIKVSMATYSPLLTRDIFLAILDASVQDAVVNPELGVDEWLKYEGFDTDLSVARVREDTCQRLCTRALELYDTCYDLGVNSTGVMNYEPELREAFISNVSRNSLNVQASIIRHEVRIGRKIYHGYADWRQYTTRMVAELNTRLDEALSENRTIVNCVENSERLLSTLPEFFIPISEYGIPPIDESTPILRHRMVVIVGKENIGKSKFAVDQAVNILLSGHKVAYMCGETQQGKIYADILINYIWKKFGLVVRPEHLVTPEECPTDVRKAIGMAKDTVVTEGNVILCDAFSYDTVFEQLQSLYDETQFDAVIIDHSCALVGTTGDGSLKSKIDALSSACVKFKKNYPVCVMVTSHPSTSAKNTDARGRETNDSSAKGSQNLSTDADEVFFLRDNMTLQKQGLLMIENCKRRDASRLTDYVVFRKNFAVSALISDESFQNSTNKIAMEQNEALSLAMETYNSGENPEDYSL